MTFTHSFVSPPKLERSEDLFTGKRFYLGPDGQRYSSVTTWLSENWDKTALDKWRKRIGDAEADRISNRAAGRGTNLHNLLEAYLRNEALPEQNFLTKTLFAKVRSNVNKINNIRLIETPIYSTELGLAGTPDVIADFDDTLAVIDFKTSITPKKKMYIVNYFLQTACYAKMYNELFNQMPRKSVLIIAVEEQTQPQIFIEPMDTCIKMLDKFVIDPVAFQKKIKAK